MSDNVSDINITDLKSRGLHPDWLGIPLAPFIASSFLQVYVTLQVPLLLLAFAYILDAKARGCTHNGQLATTRRFMKNTQRFGCSGTIIMRGWRIVLTSAHRETNRDFCVIQRCLATFSYDSQGICGISASSDNLSC